MRLQGSLGGSSGNHRRCRHNLPTPLAGGQRKIIGGANDFSLAFGQGGGHLIFDVCFDFLLCYPKGAHSLHHRWGQLPTSGCKFNFPLCYPKGAHSLHHRLGQFPTSGCKFNFPCATPRGLIRWVTIWGNSPLLAANSIFHCATPRGLIRWVIIWGNYTMKGK